MKNNLFKLSILCVLATTALSGETFTPFQTEKEIQKNINFLTSTSEKHGAGYIGTAGGLNNKYLPLSYYSTPSYWGEYVCDELGNDCRVIDVFNPYDYTLAPTHDSPGRELQYERVNVSNGTDIYDASTWQIALALAGREGLRSARKSESLFEMVENQNLLLLYGHDGQHQSDKIPFGANRATTQKDGTYTYNGTKISESEKAYFFRMVSKQWLAQDPFAGTEYAQNITVRDLPDDNPQYQKGKVSWADWKPITGENGWAFFLGPLQADYIKYVETEGMQYVPFSSTSMQNAIQILHAFQALQSPKGGVYYAVKGSLGNVGDESVNPYEISVENNASLLGGLWVFQDLLKLSLEQQKDLKREDKIEVTKAIKLIDAMIYGGETSENYRTEGMLAFFKNYAWDKKQGMFLQGGIANDPNADSDWIPTYTPKAVDVQTWTITVLGQPMVDEWYGFGSAFRAWEATKEWGAFYGPKGELWGVGYSERDGNGTNGHFEEGIISAEWTMGAVNLVRSLIVHYGAVIDDETASSETRKSAMEYVQRLREDERSMVEKLIALRTDRYSEEEVFEGNRPTEFDSLIVMPKDKLAFLYASKRYFIPFGWFANPIPSTCSTSWALMLHYNYNPFQLGGGYINAHQPSQKD